MNMKHEGIIGKPIDVGFYEKPNVDLFKLGKEFSDTFISAYPHYGEFDPETVSSLAGALMHSFLKEKFPGFAQLHMRDQMEVAKALMDTLRINKILKD